MSADIKDNQPKKKADRNWMGMLNALVTLRDTIENQYASLDSTSHN